MAESRNQKTTVTELPLSSAIQLPPLHELLAHTHLLTERQRRQSSIGSVGPLLCVHAEGMQDGQPVVVDRFFAADCSPAAALTAMRNYGPARDHLLFVVDAPAERQRAFGRVGFRLVETQWQMACSLADWQPAKTETAMEGEVRRATGAGDAVALSAIDGLEPVQIAELRDPALIHYYVAVNNHPVTYGRNAHYDSEITWVSHVYTSPEHRRLGYASALMERIQADSVQAGIARSMLLATSLARALYIRIGYTKVADVAILQAPPVLLRRNAR